nr:MAG TPA: putative tail fiber protein [Caudoviricetes sp.]
MFQWGLNSISTNTTVSLPTSFLNTNYTLLNSYDDLPTGLFPAKVTRQSKTSFVATANYGSNPVSNINIGWFAVGI